MEQHPIDTNSSPCCFSFGPGTGRPNGFQAGYTFALPDQEKRHQGWDKSTQHKQDDRPDRSGDIAHETDGRDLKYSERSPEYKIGESQGKSEE